MNVDEARCSCWVAVFLPMAYLESTRFFIVLFFKFSLLFIDNAIHLETFLVVDIFAHTFQICKTYTLEIARPSWKKKTNRPSGVHFRYFKVTLPPAFADS